MKEIPYWNLIERYSREAKVDPYLMASLIRTESNFNPNAVSSCSAKGLCQFMPLTAKECGIEGKEFDPSANIEAGCKYLSNLISRFGEIPLESEKIRFALASYNMGRGWINKALMLARKSEGLYEKYNDWKANGSKEGKWQTWEFTKEFLKNFKVDWKQTFNYVDKIQKFYLEYLEERRQREEEMKENTSCFLTLLTKIKNIF